MTVQGRSRIYTYLITVMLENTDICPPTPVDDSNSPVCSEIITP